MRRFIFFFAVHIDKSTVKIRAIRLKKTRAAAEKNEGHAIKSKNISEFCRFCSWNFCVLRKAPRIATIASATAADEGCAGADALLWRFGTAVRAFPDRLALAFPIVGCRAACQNAAGKASAYQSFNILCAAERMLRGKEYP